VRFTQNVEMIRHPLVAEMPIIFLVYLIFLGVVYHETQDARAPTWLVSTAARAQALITPAQ
jgi:hypothetical protein